MKDRNNEIQSVENNELSLESLEEVSGGCQKFEDFDFMILQQQLNQAKNQAQNREQNRQEMKKTYGSPSAEELAKREEAAQKLKESILGGAYNIANGAASVSRKP